MERHDTLEPESPPIPSIYRNRDYLILWGGQAVSATGSMVSRLAFPLLILALTHSPAQAGAVSALNIVPYVILAILAGALADRWDRRTIMIVADSGRAIALGSIPLATFLGQLTLAQIYVVALIDGTLNVFFDLAEVGALRRVVGVEQLPRAMAQNNATFSVASLTGQPLGGLLFQIGRGFPFLVDGVSYAVSVISLCFIKTRFQEERHGPPIPLRSQIVEGFTWLWRQRLIRFLAFLNATIWTVYAGNYLLMIVIAQRQHAPPAIIGVITAASALGGIGGALLVPRVQASFSFAQVVVGGLAVNGILWALYGIVPNPVSLGIVAACLSLVFNVYNVVQMSYRIALIPDELQGRVNGLFRLVSFIGMPIGTTLAGVLLQVSGIGAEVAFGAAWFAVLAVVAAASGEVRRARITSAQQAA